MTAKRLTSVQDILSNSNQNLTNIIKHANKLNQLNDLVNTYLPKDLQKYCKALNIRRGVLMLEVNSSVWAAKLHFEKPNLLHNLRKHPKFCGLVSISHKIKPQTSIIPTTKKVASQPLSSETTATLRRAVVNSKNKKLKISLNKLLRHHGK